MADRASAGAAVFFVLLQVGCSAADDGAVDGAEAERLTGYSAVETRAMLSAAEELGFARGSLSLGDGAIVAESDMLLDPETLLELSGRAGAEGPGLQTEGYYTRGTVSAQGVYSVIPPRANSIRLSFEAAVPEVWRTAIRNGAAQWNPNECIQISENSGNDKLLVKVDATLPAGVLAIAFLPTTRQGVVVPGSEIRVAPNPGVGASALKYAAMHELGHTLGFHHPGSGKHIPGTSVDTDPTDASSYATVLSLVGPTRSTLSSDDVTSRDAMFRRFTRLVNGQPVTACPDGVGTLVF